MRKTKKSVLQQVGEEVTAELTAEGLTPERIALAYARLFSGEDGAIVLADLKAKFNGTTVNMRSRGIDPFETHFREGERHLYLHLVESKTPPPAHTTDEEN